jgi:hypothetical protein
MGANNSLFADRLHFVAEAHKRDISALVELAVLAFPGHAAEPTWRPRKTMTTVICHVLPRKAKRSLLGSLRPPAGTRLPVDWYEYHRNSNFDKWPREQIKIAVE